VRRRAQEGEVPLLALEAAKKSAGSRVGRLLDATTKGGKVAGKDAARAERARLDDRGVQKEHAAGLTLEDHDLVSIETDIVRGARIPGDAPNRTSNDGDEEHHEEHDPGGDHPIAKVAAISPERHE
jgi:hypothetical protein